MNKKQIKLLLKEKTLQSHFNSLIDAIIYYDNVNEDSYGWDIVHEIEKIEIIKYVDLMIENLVEKNYSSNTLIYNSLWYGLINSPSDRNSLKEAILRNRQKDKIIYFLRSLDDKSNEEGIVNLRNFLQEF